MQKQKIQFLALLAAVALLCAAYAGIHFYNENQEKKEAENEAAETITVTDMEVSDITQFSYVLDGETLSFSKSGDDWQYDGDASLDIDEDAIETLLSKVNNVTAGEEVTEYENLTDFGLDTPSNTIVIKTAEKEITLYIGNENEITNQYYLKKADDDTVYLVGSAAATGFTKTVEDLTVVEETTETETEEISETEETNETEEVSETEEINETEQGN